MSVVIKGFSRNGIIVERHQYLNIFPKTWVWVSLCNHAESCPQLKDILSADWKLLDTLLIIPFYPTHWLENVAFLNHTCPVTIFDFHPLLNRDCGLSRSMKTFFILLVFYTKNNKYCNSPVSTSGLNKYQNMFNTVEMYYTVYITKLLQSFTFFFLHK